MRLEFTEYLLVLGIVIPASVYLWINRKSSALPEASKSDVSKAAPTKAKPNCPPGFIPVLTASDLFKEVRAEPLLTHIYQSLAFAPENYSVDVEPLLTHVAEFTQLLPASESHHHANPGGLLTHILEVASISLRLCEEAKLPVGRPTEEQLKNAARWRYGVLVGALLHDIGKPICDVIVHINSNKGELVVWNGLAGLIRDYGQSYKVSFPLSKDYKSHQKLPVMLLKSMIPASTMKWLSEDPELIPLLIAYLSGESSGGMIGQLVKTADGKSVSKNLLEGSRTRFATARQVPLIERMMSAMRRMLEEGGHIILNRDGAAGFCDGEDIWFVAGVIADKVRQYLDQNEKREEGAAGLPTDNSRLFDVWKDYGVIKLNEGAAIWRAVITIEKGDDKKWVQNFTLLRFPLSTLYESPASYPSKLNGNIELISEIAAAASVAAEESTPEPNPAPTTSPNAIASEPSADRPSFELTKSPPDPPASPPSSGLDEWSPNFGDLAEPGETLNSTAKVAPLAEKLTDPSDEFLDEADMAIAPPPVPQETNSSPSAPVAPAQVRPPKNSVLGNIPGPDPEVEQMMAWLQKGIASRELKYNRADASIHFVEEGILLITPKIFKEFILGTNPDASPDDKDVGTKVKRLQRHLQKSGYVNKSSKSSHLHFYRIVNARNPARSTVTGYLIHNPSQFFNPVPESNQSLERLSGATQGEGEDE